MERPAHTHTETVQKNTSKYHVSQYIGTVVVSRAQPSEYRRYPEQVPVFTVGGALPFLFFVVACLGATLGLPAR